MTTPAVKRCKPEGLLGTVLFLLFKYVRLLATVKYSVKIVSFRIFWWMCWCWNYALPENCTALKICAHSDYITCVCFSCLLTWAGVRASVCMWTQRERSDRRGCWPCRRGMAGVLLVTPQCHNCDIFLSNAIGSIPVLSKMVRSFHTGTPQC